MTEPDTATRELALRRERRRFLLPQVAVLLVLVGIVVAISVLDGSGSSDAAVWWIALATEVVLLVVVDVVILVLLRSPRRHRTKLLAVSPLFELPTGRDRKALVRALRRGDPIAPEQRDLARRTATDLIGRRAQVWLFSVLAVLMAANAVLQPLAHDFETFSLVLGAFMLVTAVLMVANASYYGWLIRRMRRVLSELDASGPGPGRTA